MEWGISLKRNSLRNKIWFYFTSFSVCILAGLWLFQVAFLNTYYEYQKKQELNRIAFKIQANYGSENFETILDELAYQNGVCIEIISKELLQYSSMSVSRGCIDSGTQNVAYKKNFLESGEVVKKYQILNNRFHNKTFVYAMKLDKDLYVFINVSLEPLGSTTKILASQLVYVSVVVLALSFLLAYFVSKKISAPIVKLTTAAKQMSKGEYDVVFETGADIEELDELAVTLNQARCELSKTDELRRELLANVSHDLKTPLTMIRAYAEMVRDLTFDQPEKRVEDLNIIIDETERLNLLVEDILELSKIQSDVDTLHLEEFDLNEMIHHILNKFKYLEETEGYHFIYERKDVYLVKADERKLEQVIYNLVGNAINYVGEDKEVIVTLTEKVDRILVEVTDHGKGIDPEEIDYIWDKYYKVDKTHKRNVVGTGLGLSIVKNILLRHDYTYGVRSEKGKGSTFYFELPKLENKKRKQH